MNLVNLTPEVRAQMAAEVSRDIEAGQLYFSQRFTERGRQDYPGLLQQAIAEHDIAWLAGELRQHGRLATMETFSGGKPRKVPSNAAEMLAEGEFNRFYCRGVCLDVLTRDPEAEVEVYRAKPVSSPRPESQRVIGTRVKASALLDDLRVHQGVDTALGVPAGPNSGLSVKTLAV